MILPTTALCLLSATAIGQAPSGQTPEQQMKAYAEAMRKDLRTEKQAIVDQAMGLEPAEKSKFWGIYDGYQKEVTALWDQRIANIKTYAQSYDSMTDATADQIAAAGMKNEQAGQALRAKYYKQYKTAMGSKVAARFLQVETTLNHLAGLQLMSELPLIK